MTFIARLLLVLCLSAAVSAQGKNLLFYGNSFTYYSWGYGVPELVGMIAVEAGHPAPTIRAALRGGGSLTFHATDPGQIAAIGNSLPPGQTWDSVVMQGSVIEATDGGGWNAAQFRSSAVAIATNVRNHSPQARAVMYQTWATAYGQLYYNFPSPWQNPMALHDEIRSNYQLAVGDIRAVFGPGAANNAAVGDAVAHLEWNPAWYEGDLFHPSPAMILLAAMSIYSAIYEQPVGAITPSFNPPGIVAQALAPFGLGIAQWNLLAGLADTCAAPALRAFPGSGDHLLLESATDGNPLTAGARRFISSGTLLQLRMRSMNGVYENAPGFLLLTAFPTGLPPVPSLLYPEVRADLGGMLILGAAGSMASPLSWAVPVPLTLPGLSCLVQGIVLQASAQTGNPLLTATDGCELVFY